MSKKIWYLQQLDLFADLKGEILSKIESLFTMKEYCKKEIIFEPGDQNKVFILKTGQVEVYQLTPSGKKVIIEVLKPDSIFGDLGIDTENETYVEAKTDSYVCLINKDKFFHLISGYPVLSEKLMRKLFNRLILVEKRVSSLAVDSALERFVKLLLSLGKKAEGNTQEKANMELAEKFTHEELAQMLGISRQTMTTLINRMEKDGLLLRSGKRLQFEKSRLEKITS